MFAPCFPVTLSGVSAKIDKLLGASGSQNESELKVAFSKFIFSLKVCGHFLFIFQTIWLSFSNSLIKIVTTLLFEECLISNVRLSPGFSSLLRSIH